ncbi:MAG TPA: hypothetical protein VI299_03855 [Polyangiales bacterium]
MVDEQQVLEKAKLHWQREAERIGAVDAIPSRASDATWDEERQLWAVRLMNCRGMLARYVGREDSLGRVRFSVEPAPDIERYLASTLCNWGQVAGTC